VQAVAAKIGDPCVRPAKPSAGLLPALGRLATTTIGCTRAAAASELPVEPTQPPLGVLQRSGIGDLTSIRQHCQMADANVDPDPGLGPARAGHSPLDLAGEADEPAATLPRDTGRKDLRGALLSRRASLRVDSWVLSRPSLGSTTWCRSGSTRIAPVVNRHASRARPLRLNRGKPTRGPARVPLRLAAQFLSDRASASRPAEYASLEFSGHQGATSSFARFHSRRNPGSVHGTWTS
jgi:hypothetical protein